MHHDHRLDRAAATPAMAASPAVGCWP